MQTFFSDSNVKVKESNAIFPRSREQILKNLALIRPVFCIGAIVKPNWNKVCKKKKKKSTANTVLLSANHIVHIFSRYQ